MAEKRSYCGRGICAALEDHPGSCAAASGWADVYECPECDSCLASDRPIRIHHHGDLSHEVEYLSDPEPHALALCDRCGHARSLHPFAARCRADRGNCTCEAFRREPEPPGSTS